MRGGCAPLGALIMVGGGGAIPPGGTTMFGGKEAFGGTTMVPSLVIDIDPSHGHGEPLVFDVRWKWLNQPVLGWQSLSRNVPQPEANRTPAKLRNVRRG